MVASGLTSMPELFFTNTLFGGDDNMNKKTNTNEEEAVSPVIATILMVAITVVLAGVLYVWASSLAEGNTDGSLTFYQFDAEGDVGAVTTGTSDDLVRVTMTQGAEINWASLNVQISIDNGAPVTCDNPGLDGGDCVLVEFGDTTDSVWSIGDGVTVRESGQDLCSSVCTAEITITDVREGSVIDRSSAAIQGGAESGSSSGSDSGSSSGSDSGSSSSTNVCAAGDIIITEAHADGAPEDYIELKNTGSQACSLEGWQLYDQGKADDGVGDLTFGDMMMQPGAYWLGCEDLVTTGTGHCADADTTNVFTFGISKGGDTIYLAAPGQSTSSAHTFVVPDFEDNGAAELCNGAIQPTGPGGETPGADNGCARTVALTEVANKGSETVCGGVAGDAGDDWIEIWNYGTSTVSLTGFMLTDDKGPSDSDAFTFGASASLAANTYMVLCKDGADSFVFGIGGGDTVTLYDTNSNVLGTTSALPEAACEAAADCNPDDVYAMDDTGAWDYTSSPTPGEAN